MTLGRFFSTTGSISDDDSDYPEAVESVEHLECDPVPHNVKELEGKNSELAEAHGD